MPASDESEETFEDLVRRGVGFRCAMELNPPYEDALRVGVLSRMRS